MSFAKANLITTQTPIAYDDRFFDILKGYFEKRRAARQLNGMSDRELADIGICRAEIKQAVAGDLYR
ncbi:MAG: DUF1127 domain-containing protein [Sneathiella sp.]